MASVDVGGVCSDGMTVKGGEGEEEQGAAGRKKRTDGGKGGDTYLFPHLPQPKKQLMGARTVVGATLLSAVTERRQGNEMVVVEGMVD